MEKQQLLLTSNSNNNNNNDNDNDHDTCQSNAVEDESLVFCDRTLASALLFDLFHSLTLAQCACCMSLITTLNNKLLIGTCNDTYPVRLRLRLRLRLCLVFDLIEERTEALKSMVVVPNARLGFLRAFTQLMHRLDARLTNALYTIADQHQTSSHAELIGRILLLLANLLPLLDKSGMTCTTTTTTTSTTTTTTTTSTLASDPIACWH
jgi:hypothetical protein